MNKSYRIFLFSFALALILLLQVASADNVTSCEPIFLGGEYILQNDITGVQLIDCIYINASNVTFDCNGFKIIGINTINGVLIDNQNDTTIKNCNFESFIHGIKIDRGYNSTIFNNNFNSNYYAIRFQNTSNNTVTGNTINQCSQYSLVLVSSSDNLIYDNVLYSIQNIIFAGEIGPNFWNNSVRGNSWSSPRGKGFSQTCLNLDNNSICDTNYTLNSNNTDFLPLFSSLSCIEDCGPGTGGNVKKPKQNIYSINQTDLSYGFHQVYSIDDSLKINFNGEIHKVSMNKISPSFVIINVSSELQQALFFVGDTKFFSFTPGWYNLSITLNKILESGTKVNLTIRDINQIITLPEENNFSTNTFICTEAWSCNKWSECQENKQSRECVDLNNCSKEENRPLIEQDCKTSKMGVKILIISIIISISIIIGILIKRLFIKKYKY